MKKSTIFSLGLVLSCCFVGIASAQLGAGDGLLDSARETAGFAEATETTFAENVGSVVRIALSLLGIIFTILIIYAGIMWMTARGKQEQIEKARKTITASVIGLIITVAAYSITAFVVPQIISQTSGDGLSGSDSSGRGSDGTAGGPPGACCLVCPDTRGLTCNASTGEFRYEPDGTCKQEEFCEPDDDLCTVRTRRLEDCSGL